jgi:hypothetical protein
MKSINSNSLKKRITTNIQSQGFFIENGKILPPENLTKDKIRQMHAESVECKRTLSKKGLIQHESELISFIAHGHEVEPENILPQLIEVRPNSKESLLFRYASLHWSIPTSNGYGRRIRYLVFDQQNGKLIGLFGLGDPIFDLAGRDNWIGWDRQTRKNNLQYVMDAYILGAVPPYSSLLCGKLVAMLTTSNEVLESFKKKYQNSQSIIKEKSIDGQLALITTMSALGKSSLYDRIKFKNQKVFESVGYTLGSGEFHFSNGLYKEILNYAQKNCMPTARPVGWGNGFRNRREVIEKCLNNLGLSQKLLYHKIPREIYVAPLASNTQDFLKGEQTELIRFDRSQKDLFDFFRERWLIPRSQRNEGYKNWDPKEWILWNSD